jgi:hypothetical protein
MTQDYPKLIAPPPELVQQWWEEADQYQDDPKTYFDYVATEAAQWGADQELEACCAYMQHEDFHGFATELRAARRPKPQSLKERALQAWACVEAGTDDQTAMAVIRRALEALPDD